MLDVIVSTNNGLFRINPNLTKIADGDFFGITKIYGDYWAVADRTHEQLVLLDLKRNIIFKRINYGITKHTHQIDFFKGMLFVVHTENNAIASSKWDYQKMTLEKQVMHYPNGIGGRGDRNYCHFNSIIFYKNQFYIMAHNLGEVTNKNSELFIMNSKLELTKTIDIGQKSCHNIVPFNESFLTCYSKLGSISNFKEIFFTDSASFTRGLSANNDYIIFGVNKSSEMLGRKNYDSFVKIYYNDFTYKDTFIIPKSCINDIRQITQDFGISDNYNKILLL